MNPYNIYERKVPQSLLFTPPFALLLFALHSLLLLRTRSHSSLPTLYSRSTHPLQYISGEDPFIKPCSSLSIVYSYSSLLTPHSLSTLCYLASRFFLPQEICCSLSNSRFRIRTDIPLKNIHDEISSLCDRTQSLRSPRGFLPYFRARHLGYRLEQNLRRGHCTRRQRLSLSKCCTHS